MNKRFTLFLLFLALSIGCATAQITLTPKAGVTFSNYNQKNTFGNTINEFYEPGILGGVSINFPFLKAPWLSLQPEILYLQKQYASQISARYIDFDAEVKFPKQRRILHYVEVPVLLKASRSKGNWQGYVNAGPALGYALAGKHRGGNNEVDYNFEHTNRLEVSIQAGAGLGWKLGSGTLILDARFSYGLTYLTRDYILKLPIRTESEQMYVDIEIQPDHKNNTLSLSLGYAIPLSGL